ncbi:MAG TPA: hypothetical protein PLO67_09210 [Saprospiraceae bacterium]|nr:hypothetical protein [Saprospiraceae bacterium]HPI05338.1 hypothetical protein [Saprospiraceae bacterium]
MWTTIWKEFYDITTLPLVCLTVTCFLCVQHWSRLPAAFRILAVFLFFNLFIEIGARFAGIFYGMNLPLLHVYTVGELLLFSLFYKKTLDPGSIFRRYFEWIVGTVLVLVVLNSVFIQHIFEFNSYAKTLVQILIILYALDYAFRFSEQAEMETQQNRSLRLINSAVLIYYCGSLFVFMSSQFELETGGALQILWDINTVLNLIFQMVVLFALWKVAFHLPKLSSSSAPAS